VDSPNKQPAGTLKISEEVLATIAKVAALEIDGVDSLVQPTGSVKRFLGRSINNRWPIRIEMHDDFTEIEIRLRLKFGAKITEVCAAVQQNIKDNIQTMTGIAVSKVNVDVEGIVFPDETAGAEE
jgi:uncharacterized alkaline shock family protein YloU